MARSVCCVFPPLINLAGNGDPSAAALIAMIDICCRGLTNPLPPTGEEGTL